MATVICTTEDVGEGSSSLVVDLTSVFYSAGAGASELGTAETFYAVEDTADGASTIDYTIGWDVVSTANATSAVSAGTVTTELVEDLAAAADSIVRAVENTLESTADGTEVMTGEHSFAVSSVAQAVSAATGSRVVTALLESSGVGRSSFGATSDAVLESTADGTEVMTGDASPLLISTANATSAVVAYVSKEIELASEALAVSSIAAGLDAVTEVVSAGVARSSAQLDGAAGGAFWTNTESMAAATWAGVPFDSYAMVGDVLYAVGEGGVYALDADDDLGEPIDARVRGDKTDLGITQKKRVSVAYTAGDLAAPMHWTVSTEQGSWGYLSRKPNYDDTTNHRVTFGKGLAGRYVRFELKNVNGADFDVKDNTVLVAPVARRIGS